MEFVTCQAPFFITQVLRVLLWLFDRKEMKKCCNIKTQSQTTLETTLQRLSKERDKISVNHIKVNFSIISEIIECFLFIHSHKRRSLLLSGYDWETCQPPLLLVQVQPLSAACGIHNLNIHPFTGSTRDKINSEFFQLSLSLPSWQKPSTTQWKETKSQKKNVIEKKAQNVGNKSDSSNPPRQSRFIRCI